MNQLPENANYPQSGPKHNPYTLPSEILNQAKTNGPALEADARIIRDVLEARTNGMFNSGDNELLKQINGSSPFTDWKQLILAIDCLYSGKWSGMETLLASISPESAPGCLLDVLSALAEVPGGKEKRAGFSSAEKRLYNQVAEDRRFIKSLAIQLEDTLEAGEEYFHDFALLAIREIREIDETIAQRLALWTLDRYYQEDFDYISFLNALKEVFPPAVAMRLSALTLSEELPGEGSKCWLLSLLYRIREENLVLSEIRKEAAEYLWLSSCYLTYFLTDNPGEEDLPGTLEELFQLLTLLGRELSAVFALPLPMPDPDLRLEELTVRWAVSLAPELSYPGLDRLPESEEKKGGETKSREQKQESGERPGKTRKKSRPAEKQLELFSHSAKEEPAAVPAAILARQENREGSPRTFAALPKNPREAGWQLLSLASLESPREMKELIKTRPRYVGPEPWLAVIKQKRRSAL